jgi:hypothetical protein
MPALFARDCRSSGLFRVSCLSLLAIAYGAGGARGDDGDAANVESRLRESLTVLASDEFEGRGIGTEGLRKAQQYISEQFRAAGLDVVSAGGDPYQEFDVVDGATLEAPNTLEFHEPDSQTVTLELGTDFQVCSFGEAATFDAPLVFVGYGIESDDPAFNDFQSVNVEGKVVVILRRTPQQGREHGLFPSGPHGATREAAIRTKVSNAFRHGAAGILFVNDLYTGRTEAESIAVQVREAETEVAALAQQVAESAGDAAALQEARNNLQKAKLRLMQTEQVAADHNPDPLMDFGYGGVKSGKTVPILHISQAACDRLLTAAGHPSLAELEAVIDETGAPHSLDLAGWRATGQTSLSVKNVPVANVVGVIPGAGPHADETIVIGAHYDHLGFGGEGSLAPASKDIHNGADDNASGTSALLEVARHFAARKTPPARRLVFIAFTGEERGLLGSAEYVREPVFALESTIAMFNMDMVGRLVDDELTVFGSGTSARWEPLLDSAAAPQELTLIKKPEGFGPSDHSSFYAKEIPVLHLFTGTHDDYHRPSDDAEKINVDGMRRIVGFLETIVDDTLAQAERPGYIAIEQRAELTRSGSRPYFGSIPDFGTNDVGYALQGVSPGSPADLAGLKGGDVIIALGENQIGSLDDFDLALRKFAPGEQVEVTIRRGNEELKLPVVLGSPRS